jgi:hypothetical protein
MRTGGSDLTSMRQMRGATERDREKRNSSQQKNFRRLLRDVTPDDFAQERQRRAFVKLRLTCNGHVKCAAAPRIPACAANDRPYPKARGLRRAK